MDWLQTLVLALIQGLTEFLPISSSAHLILPSQLLGWPDQGLGFDVAVHLGSLVAILAYFRRELGPLAQGFLASFAGRRSHEGQLVWMLAVATLPAGLAGLLGKDYIEAHLRSAQVIAWATIGFGLLLGLADRRGGGAKTLLQITWPLALAIGVAQALALIPGTSRSGITITAALFLGFSRTDSARFSFLLSIPVIALSAAYLGYKMVGQVQVDWAAIGMGFVVSAASAYLCIRLFMRLIERVGMTPFVIYRLVLGAGLLWLLA